MSQSAKTRYIMVIVMQIYIYRNITMSGNVSRKIDDGRQQEMEDNGDDQDDGDDGDGQDDGDDGDEGRQQGMKEDDTG